VQSYFTRPANCGAERPVLHHHVVGVATVGTPCSQLFIIGNSAVERVVDQALRFVAPVRRLKRHSIEVRIHLQVRDRLGVAHLVGRAGEVARRLVAAADHHHLVAVVPRVDDVIDEAGLGLEPADLALLPWRGITREARRHLVEEAQLVPAGRESLHVVEQREVVQDRRAAA
jgi:hypothetical protein